MIVPPWLQIAYVELGQKEIEGLENNPRILEYQQATSLKASDDETPWCSAFVNWCLQKAGYLSTKSAAALSWQNYGIKLRHPCLGCIVVYDHGDGRGHVGFAVAYEQRVGGQFYLAVLGGNQSNQVKVSLFKSGTACAYVVPSNYHVPNGGYSLPKWTGEFNFNDTTR